MTLRLGLAGDILSCLAAEQRGSGAERIVWQAGTQAHCGCYGPTACGSPQRPFAGRVLSHRQSQRALCSLPHIPMETHMGRGQVRSDPVEFRESRADP
jgi:hypothetical protein